MRVRRPIQVWRARRGAGCVVRPQKVWLTSCPGAVRWHRVSRDLKHRRRGRQRERQETIVLISKTLALHVHYTLWYISLPSSAKQRREMTKFKVLWRT